MTSSGCPVDGLGGVSVHRSYGERAGVHEHSRPTCTQVHRGAGRAVRETTRHGLERAGVVPERRPDSAGRCTGRLNWTPGIGAGDGLKSPGGDDAGGWRGGRESTGELLWTRPLDRQAGPGHGLRPATAQAHGWRRRRRGCRRCSGPRRCWVMRCPRTPSSPSSSPWPRTARQTTRGTSSLPPPRAAPCRPSPPFSDGCAPAAVRPPAAAPLRHVGQRPPVVSPAAAAARHSGPATRHRAPDRRQWPGGPGARRHGAAGHGAQGAGGRAGWICGRRLGGWSRVRVCAAPGHRDRGRVAGGAGGAAGGTRARKTVRTLRPR